MQCYFCTIGKAVGGSAVLPINAVTEVGGTPVCRYHANPSHLIWTQDGQLCVHETARFYAGYETLHEPEGATDGR